MCFFFFFFFFFFLTLFIKIQVIFINFKIPYFLVKKSSKIYFLKNSQQHINLSHRSIFGLPQHTIFSTANWNNNTTSLFPLVYWQKFSPAQIASCWNVNHVVDSYYLPKLFFIDIRKVISKLIGVTTAVIMVCQGKI